MKKFSLCAFFAMSFPVFAEESLTICEWLEQTADKTLLRIIEEENEKLYIVRDAKDGEHMSEFELRAILDAMQRNEIQQCGWWEK